ncbi:MAG: hypothetical protein JWP89_3702 [Schlesneria sp.]|nr:hypothetical protein [Schlesneria sp.]
MNWRFASFLGLLFIAASIVMGSGGPTTEHPEIANLKKQFQADMEPVRKKFRTRLENLQKELTRKGDLDGALAVKTELESIGTPEKPVPKNPVTLKGNWTVTYSPSGNVRKYSIRDDGRVEMVGDKLFGQITKNGDDWLLDFNDGKLEKLAIKEVLFIEHFEPKTGYAMGDKPRQTATGDKGVGK